MSTVTIDEIKSEHAKVAEMIAKFEAQSKTRVLMFGAHTIKLLPGEEYAGIIVGKDDEPSYHLILLPGEATSINWTDAKDWAGKTGGELPTRREQALLYANQKDQFQQAYYWSSEQHAANSDCAWYQHFGSGGQDGGSKSASLRARAVRRLIIQ